MGYIPIQIISQILKSLIVSFSGSLQFEALMPQLRTFHTVYIYSWKSFQKIWPILVMQLRKCEFILIVCDIYLDNGVHPPGAQWNMF